MKRYMMLLSLGLLLSGCMPSDIYVEEVTTDPEPIVFNSDKPLTMQGDHIVDEDGSSQDFVVNKSIP